jgi:hypothetical protein
VFNSIILNSLLYQFYTEVLFVKLIFFHKNKTTSIVVLVVVVVVDDDDDDDDDDDYNDVLLQTKDCSQFITLKIDLWSHIAVYLYFSEFLYIRK